MKKSVFLILLMIVSLQVFSAGEIIVAKDGSGHFSSITEALNSIPANNTEWKTILVKNGVYDEHVMIKNNYIALVGESRKGARIEHSLPRAAWYAANGVNTGTGVINVWTNMHDVVIANLFIRNTFEGSEDYTEVIRTETGTTRIWVVNCDVLCLWKDTFAPWGKAGGMYYVADCAFRGSIDAFCPRGYCYALNSTFTETKSSSPIWHEGVAGENQRLVIQGGSVHSEYNKSVKLQNSQNYAQFYYLDVRLSDSITELGKSATTFFYGVKGKAGLSWFADNISLTERKVMDAVWTYEGKWDPENTMPSVLPYAAIPQPYNGRYGLPAAVTKLKWIKARDAINHRVYFGKTENPDFFSETFADSVTTPELEINTTYYWKVVTTTSAGEIAGNTWRFSTADTISLPNDTTPVIPGDTSQIDYAATRLTNFETILNCLTMKQEPAWITKTGSVNWSGGTGYRWGSTSAVLTLKVNGCTSVDITFTNSGTSRPVVVGDGGIGNEVTDYPVTANNFKTLTFIPKTTGDDDITIKTAGSSGLTISRIVFKGVNSEVYNPFEDKLSIKISGRILHTQEKVDIFDFSGKRIVAGVSKYALQSGVYFVRFKQHYHKILIP